MLERRSPDPATMHAAITWPASFGLGFRPLTSSTTPTGEHRRDAYGDAGVVDGQAGVRHEGVRPSPEEHAGQKDGKADGKAKEDGDAAEAGVGLVFTRRALG